MFHAISDPHCEAFMRRIFPYVSVLLAVASSGCLVRGGGGLFFAAAETAILTAAIISAT